MKKQFIISMLALVLLLVLSSLTSCETKEEIQSDIDLAKVERAELYKLIVTDKAELNSLSQDIFNAGEKLQAANIFLNGGTAKYLIKFRLKQSHFTLDVGKHMKDAMNKIEFEMPVDADYYNSLSAGDNIVSNFRVGSAIMEGSFGKWKMTVVSKRVSQ